MTKRAEDILPIVRRTREMLLPHWGAVEGTTKAGADAASVVTELDLAVERYLADALSIADPNAGFAGEEFGGSRNRERFWLCDPIDGTAHFVRGLPFCRVMLALIENGVVNFAVVYDFLNDEAYWAERGSGAYKNEIRLHVSDRGLDHAYLAWETKTIKPENMQKTVALKQRGILFEAITSGYEYALVAEGKLEGRICFDPWGNDWDYAPGSLLVEEAGGIVANIGERTYDYQNKNFIAANPAVFRALTEGPDAIFPIKE